MFTDVVKAWKVNGVKSISSASIYDGISETKQYTCFVPKYDQYTGNFIADIRYTYSDTEIQAEIDTINKKIQELNDRLQVLTELKKLGDKK